ncbi:superoxide dismutase family protein [Streptomyces sp. NPDC007205]|uniref:superoxide dismutase family protein n=1 Tax=Streptomyces sp. NPDC007205 TaxID=3154316 RepID=UPI0033F6232B
MKLAKTTVVVAAAITMTMVTNASASENSYRLRTDARFAPPTAFIPSRAVTYDMTLVPAASYIEVKEYATNALTRVVLKVRGLRPNRTYGAHVHTKPCDSRPDDSGPHYQNQPDPHQPSVDPVYANRRNEMWLDFKTDRSGKASAVSRNDWRFRLGGAGSVVIHERGTTTGPGEAGMAGARVACFTVPLG